MRVKGNEPRSFKVRISFLKSNITKTPPSFSVHICFRMRREHFKIRFDPPFRKMYQPTRDRVFLLLYSSSFFHTDSLFPFRPRRKILPLEKVRFKTSIIKFVYFLRIFCPLSSNLDEIEWFSWTVHYDTLDTLTIQLEFEFWFEPFPSRYVLTNTSFEEIFSLRKMSLNSRRRTEKVDGSTLGLRLKVVGNGQKVEMWKYMKHHLVT